MYDHSIEPHEWKNLASDPKLAGLKKQLAAWMPKVNAANAPSENRRAVMVNKQYKELGKVKHVKQ